MELPFKVQGLGFRSYPKPTADLRLARNEGTDP